jgi:hypothetical protein
MEKNSTDTNAMFALADELKRLRDKKSALEADGSVSVVDGEIYVTAGSVSPYNQLAKYTAFTVEYRNQTVAEVKRGQSVFYESDGEAAVLRLNGAVIPQGESVTADDGYLVTDMLGNADGYIRGWVK